MNRFEVGLTWEIEDGVSLPLTVKGTYDRNRGGEDCGEFNIESIRSGRELPEKVKQQLLSEDMFLRAVEDAI